MHLVEGLADGRFAAYAKIHHSVMDGVSALRTLERMLSPDPDARDAPAPWTPPASARWRSGSACRRPELPDEDQDAARGCGIGGCQVRRDVRCQPAHSGQAYERAGVDPRASPLDRIVARARSAAMRST